MKRLLLVDAITISFSISLFFFVNCSVKKEKATRHHPIATAINEYPFMRLIQRDGSVQSARELPTKSILFIYFPDCDHCQREAKEISENIKAFEMHDVWFISTAQYPDIDRFAKTYKLMGFANIHFVRTEMPDVVNNFGGIPTPSVYIYSSEKKLLKAFNGETKIDAIIKFL